MDFRLPGSSVHGILWARILEWVAIFFSRGSSKPRDWTQVSCIAGKFFTISHQGNYIQNTKKTIRDWKELQVQLGQILDKMQKDRKAQLPFLKSWVHASYMQHHQGGGGQTTQAIPLAQPLRPPPSSPFNQLTTPTQGASKDTCCLFLLLTAAAQVPVKSCLNYSSGLLSRNFYWFQSPRTWVGNTGFRCTADWFSCKHIYFLFRFFPFVGYYKILNIVPHATQ